MGRRNWIHRDTRELLEVIEIQSQLKWWLQDYMYICPNSLNYTPNTGKVYCMKLYLNYLDFFLKWSRIWSLGHQTVVELVPRHACRKLMFTWKHVHEHSEQLHSYSSRTGKRKTLNGFQWMNKLLITHQWNNSQRNKLLTHATMWVNLRCILVNEQSRLPPALFHYMAFWWR